MILLADRPEVAGVILGQCVFSAKGELCGRFFHKTLYSIKGEKVALEASATRMPSFDYRSAIQKAWQILLRIHDHSCPWIVPQERWATIKLKDILLQ